MADETGGNGSALRDLERRLSKLEDDVRERFAKLVPPDEIRAEFEAMDLRITEEIRKLRNVELHDVRESLHQIGMRVENSVRGARDQYAEILRRLDETLEAVRSIPGGTS